MRKMLSMSLLLLVAALLGGCSGIAVPRPDPLQAQQDFARRLRWLDIPGAARYLQVDQQEAFRRRFNALQGLHITDVRLAGSSEIDPGHIDSTLEVDYYLLPSVIVKTRHLHLVWAYVDLGRWQPGYWQIVNPFPEFP